MMNTQTHMPVTVAMSQSSSTNSASGNQFTVCLNSEPYPIVDKGSDPETVRMLKEDYAGAISELTAITQYVYQNIRITDNDAFTNAVLQIAMVEMSHLNMIGDAITALGGNPTFGNGSVFWQGKHVNYAKTLPEMLKADIQSETQAIANYEKNARVTTNPQVSALIRRIIKDELLHLRFFIETLEAITGEQASTTQQSPTVQTDAKAADPAQLELTPQQLATYDGKDGRPAYIANKGIIYDVTNSPAWNNGRHDGHTAGKDLTADFANAGHGAAVLNGLPVVGKLIST